MKKVTVSTLSMIIGAAIGAVAGKCIAMQNAFKEISKTEEMAEKHLELFLLMNHWVKLKQQKRNIDEYFIKNGYRNIAIYGMSYAGETLLAELEESEVTVKYGIDKNAAQIYSEIDVLTMEDILEDVDVVVVTAITFFDEIKEALGEKINCPIISLEDILDELLIE